MPFISYSNDCNSYTKDEHDYTIDITEDIKIVRHTEREKYKIIWYDSNPFSDKIVSLMKQLALKGFIV